MFVRILYNLKDLMDCVSILLVFMIKGFGFVRIFTQHITHKAHCRKSG
jgi:hypothetical protein